MHHFIFRFHKLILSTAALLTLVAILLTAGLKLDVNLFSLLPKESPSVSAFFEIAEKVGFQSRLIAVVEVPSGVDKGDAERVVDSLAEHFLKSPMIKEVEYKRNDRQLEAFSRVLLGYLPLLLDGKDMERLAEKLTDNEINRQVRENKSLLMSPFGVLEKTLVLRDPLGLRKIMASKGPIFGGSGAPMSGRPYFSTADNRFYFIVIKPIEPPQNLSFSKKLMAEVTRLETKAFSALPEAGKDATRGISVAYTGGYPIAVSDEAVTKRDIKVTLLTSFIGVMLLFLVSFRTYKILIHAGMVLGMSVIWTLGFAKIAFGHLNILTFIFSCVLIGLGIDFAIHIINRYYSPKTAGLDTPGRLQYTFKEAGMGMIVGGVTTAVAFYSLSISDFRGFKELGYLTGTGIIICLLVMLFVLPSVLVFSSKKNRIDHVVISAGFGLRPILEFIHKCPKMILSGALIIVCILVAIGPAIRFDDNLKNFRPGNDKVFQLQDLVTRWLGRSNAQSLMVVQGRSEEEMLESCAKIHEALKELRGSGSLVGIRSISDFLPPPSRQRQNLSILRRYPDRYDIERIRASFFTAMEENGFAMLDAYDGYFRGLKKAFALSKVLLPSALLQTDIGQYLSPFVFKSGNLFKSVIYIASSKDLWTQSDTARFKQAVEHKLNLEGIMKDQYHLTGAVMLTADLKSMIIKNLKSSMVLAFLCILFTIFLYYRRFKYLILSLIPLIISLLILTGIMVLFGYDFNFMNIIVLPMIVGIGIDDGVHLTNTFRRYGCSPITGDIFETGRAVVLTSLTTLVGFGSIVLSHYPGLRSMGYVAVIGVAACMIASIIVLPAIFLFMKRP